MSARALTPYDTGARLEPSVWVTGDRRRPTEEDLDRYGKVDFNDDADETVLVIHVERDANGRYAVVIQPMGDDASEIDVILDGDLLTPEPLPPARIRPLPTTASRSEMFGRMADVDEHSNDL